VREGPSRRSPSTGFARRGGHELSGGAVAAGRPATVAPRATSRCRCAWADTVMQGLEHRCHVFSVEELIAHLSRVVPLVPGDLMALGPAAASAPRGDGFLAPGDVMRAEVEGIGVLENPVEEA